MQKIDLVEIKTLIQLYVALVKNGSAFVNFFKMDYDWVRLEMVVHAIVGAEGVKESRGCAQRVRERESYQITHFVFQLLMKNNCFSLIFCNQTHP